MLENQQILALESNKKIQKLENQLEEERQLKYSFNPSTNDRQSANAQEAKFTEEVKNVNQQYENQRAEDIGDRNKAMPEEVNDNSLEEDELLKGNNSSETKNYPDNKVEQPPKKVFAVVCSAVNLLESAKSYLTFSTLFCHESFYLILSRKSFFKCIKLIFSFFFIAIASLYPFIISKLLKSILLIFLLLIYKVILSLITKSSCLIS